MMLYRFFLLTSAFLFIVVGVLWSLGQWIWMGPAVILFFVSAAVSLQLTPSLKSFSFSLWIFAFVSAAMVYPFAFQTWGRFELKTLIVPLIQIIMFGMGTTLSLTDFTRVLSMPKAVLIGMVLQFTVMPFVGVSIAFLFGFEAGIAAGIVLVGSCPGGVASNVMTYIAKGNVALSVTMTACSTLISPIMTPLMMKLLAGQYIEIPFLNMMWTIIQIIMAPIGAGLLTNIILQYFKLTGEWMDRFLSFVAMFSICFILAIITSLSRDDLMTVGFLLICASIIHNLIGYLMGYGGAWLFGMDETSRRTIAIEVGLQNTGMGTGLAVNVLKNTGAAIAPAIFGTWMNISGSMLASWWRRKPVTPTR